MNVPLWSPHAPCFAMLATAPALSLRDHSRKITLKAADKKENTAASKKGHCFPHPDADTIVTLFNILSAPKLLKGQVLTEICSLPASYCLLYISAVWVCLFSLVLWFSSCNLHKLNLQTCKVDSRNQQQQQEFVKENYLHVYSPNWVLT